MTFTPPPKPKGFFFKRYDRHYIEDGFVKSPWYGLVYKDYAHGHVYVGLIGLNVIAFYAVGLYWWMYSPTETGRMRRLRTALRHAYRRGQCDAYNKRDTPWGSA